MGICAEAAQTESATGADIDNSIEGKTMKKKEILGLLLVVCKR